MRTQTDAVLEIIRQGRREALELSGRDHTWQQMRSFLADAGSQVEIFLKETVYSRISTRKWTFERLIDELTLQGLDSQTVCDLHALRLAYNKVKHDQNNWLRDGGVYKLLQATETSLSAIAKQNLGMANAPSGHRYERTFWIAAWDHYIGGDSEMHILLPSEEWLPSSFDMIYIDMLSWHAVVEELKQVGQLDIGEGSVPDQVFRDWKAESDFLNAGSFTGDYRALLSVLAAHERVEEILPSLKRESATSSLRNALLLATVDVAAAGQNNLAEQDLAESIRTLAAHQYAVPRYSAISLDFTPKLARLVFDVKPHMRASIVGPVWVTPATFATLAENAIARMPDSTIVIAADGRLVVQ
jgi:hypothetical protein